MAECNYGLVINHIYEKFPKNLFDVKLDFEPDFKMILGDTGRLSFKVSERLNILSDTVSKITKSEKLRIKEKNSNPGVSPDFDDPCYIKYLKKGTQPFKDKTPAIGAYGQVQIYNKDVVVHRKNICKNHSGGGLRGKITSFSRQSAMRLILQARNITNFVTMITLTYPKEFPTDGRLVKQHWYKMRQWFAYHYPNYAGLWFLEFQERGAPHYHIFGTRFIDKEKLSKAWFKIVNSGDEKHLRAGTKVEHLRHPDYAAGVYAVKYASKMEQKSVPEGYEEVGRFWGLFGKLKALKENYVSFISQIAPAIRIVKQIQDSYMIKYGKKPKKDSGRAGFTVFDASPLLKKYMEAVYGDSFKTKS